MSEQARSNGETQGPYWLRRLLSIEADCSKPNWDSYGALPVSMKAIRAAKVLCDSFDVVPTVNGGISILLASEGVSIELDADGSVVGMCVDRRHRDGVRVLAAQPREVPTSLQGRPSVGVAAMTAPSRIAPRWRRTKVLQSYTHLYWWTCDCGSQCFGNYVSADRCDEAAQRHEEQAHGT